MTESEVPGAKALREALERHHVHPKKSLGQHFVVDPNTIRKVVDLAGVDSSDGVLEIGAGAGSLTVALAAAADRVTAIEVDHRLLPVLTETLAGTVNVEVVAGDAMQLPLGGFQASAVVANLPYNIATPLVLRVLREAPSIERLTIMTQRDVGQRLAAAPGSKIYGQVSVMVAYFGKAKVVASISRRAFYPVPNVDSVLVRIDRTQTPLDEGSEWLFAVIRAGFSQRRKTLRNALGSIVEPSAAEAALAAARIPPTARAEEVGLDGFIELSRALAPSRP